MVPTTYNIKFLIVSDTHNFDFEEDGKQSPFRLPLPKVDVLLHCGDLTQCGGHSAFKKALKMLQHIDAELKLAIAGNHDLELDGPFWRTHLDERDEPEDHEEAVSIMKGKLVQDAGVTYLEEGTHAFTLRNGATFTVYASPYTPEFGDWAFPTTAAEDRFNSPSAHPVPSFPAVDIMMTHGPPKGILDTCDNGHHAGCDSLRRALARARPKMHCFRHIHEGHGASVVT